tara:strand:+ start:33250 stop:35124 length:1875 start_codon:yes stop_codon:yes gene_type:complete
MKLDTALILVVLGFLFSVNLILERTEKMDKLKHLFFTPILIFLGVLLMSMNQQSSDHVNFNDTSTLLVDVDEIASTNKVWRKTICSVRQVINSSSVEQSNEQILLFINSKNLKVGDQILVNASVKRIENKNNPGEFDAKKYWLAKNIQFIGFVSSFDYKLINHSELSWFSSKLSETRTYLNSVLESHLSGDELAVAQALILGNKGMLTSELKTSFSQAGAMHVLAVSGLHVGIVLFLLMYILKQFPRIFSKKSALLTALIVIWIYAGITGFSPSVLRATIMFTVLSLGVVLGRKGNAINVLFFSAFLLIIWNPMIIYDLGFQLSYLAMIGIFSLYRSISQLLYINNKYLRKIWEGIAVGIAAQILTFPLTLYYFHQFPNYFMLTNIGMMIFASLALGIGLLLFALNWTGVIAQFVGFLLSSSFCAMLFFIQFIEKLPGSVAKGFVIREDTVFVMYCIILALFLFKKRRKVVLAIGAFAVVTFVSIQYTRFNNLITSELVIYNSNELILSLKMKNQILCFRKEQKKSIKEANYLLSNYENIKPGEIVMHSLKEGTTEVEWGEQLVTLKYCVDGLSLQVNDSLYFIRVNHRIQKNASTKIIDMPYLQKNSEHIQLINGAYILKLKQ